MELKVKADDGQQIWLSKEDIYHGSLILVNAVHAYLENTGNKQYLDEILQPVLKQREKDFSAKDIVDDCSIRNKFFFFSL